MGDVRAALGEQGWRFFARMHRLLLRLGGRMPDDWLALMRDKLAGGEVFEVPHYVAGAVAELRVSLAVGEVALLREMARAVFGEDPMRVDEVVISEEVPATGHFRCRRGCWRRMVPGFRLGWISLVARPGT